MNKNRLKKYVTNMSRMSTNVMNKNANDDRRNIIINETFSLK